MAQTFCLDRAIGPCPSTRERVLGSIPVRERSHSAGEPAKSSNICMFPSIQHCTVLWLLIKDRLADQTMEERGRGSMLREMTGGRTGRFGGPHWTLKILGSWHYWIL